MRYLLASIVTLVLAGVATAQVGSEGSRSPAPAAPPAEVSGPRAEFPNIALLMFIEGLPTDSLLARAFMAGFRGAFAEEFFLTERDDARGGRPRASEALASRFRLAEGDPFGDEWQLQVTVMGWWGAGAGVPPPADTSGARARGAGLRVNIAALSAAAAEVGARPIPSREDLTLEMPLQPRQGFFAHAGRMVGLLAVETLHHQSGDLDEDTRLRLDRTVRRSIVAQKPPPMGR